MKRINTFLLTFLFGLYGNSALAQEATPTWQPNPEHSVVLEEIAGNEKISHRPLLRTGYVNSVPVGAADEVSAQHHVVGTGNFRNLCRNGVQFLEQFRR